MTGKHTMLLAPCMLLAGILITGCSSDPMMSDDGMGMKSMEKPMMDTMDKMDDSMDSNMDGGMKESMDSKM